ncbi:SAVED domain-containing protein [Bacillus subtilis]|uniref:SAVED domain-containing protein n=1 Tax=Bacillus subtilis TaxID=1423 RepID=UPI00397AFB35
MSVSYIPVAVKTSLWGKASGRCQYDGCNKPLWFDEVTKAEFNAAYIAHIVADKPNGPRGDKQRSELLKSDINNLMLLCDFHHRLVDIDQVDEHPESLLLEMKRSHENKMKMLTSLIPEKGSLVIFYGANIGQHDSHLSMNHAIYAMVPERYPKDKFPIELSLENSSFRDDESFYWSLEIENLRRQFNEKVKARKDVDHFSVFALAPQPLLIELGRLLSDIKATEVYQLHREPADWKWHDLIDDVNYRIVAPEKYTNTVALNISLSADIDNSRIRDVLGNEASIWTLTSDDPHNDFLKSREHLKVFRQQFRKLLNQIKIKHGQDVILHVFPAVPVAVAVEIGRVWMPKADLPLIIYDENRGFKQAIELN